MDERALTDEVGLRAFDEVAEVLVVADAERRVLDVNDAACAVFGRSRARGSPFVSTI